MAAETTGTALAINAALESLCWGMFVWVKRFSHFDDSSNGVVRSAEPGVMCPFRRGFLHSS